MGGVATAATIGMSAFEQLQQKDAQKTQIAQTKNQQNIAVNNTKNLLDQQLASRRAMLGSMGVSMDGSNQASQQKIVDDAYEDISNINSEYKYKYKNLEDKYDTSILNSATSYSKTLI